MSDQPEPSQIMLIEEDALLPEESDAVLDGAVLAEVGASVLDITGPGTIACLQGILTTDVEGPGEDSFIYGAALNPKGMIVSDLWLARSQSAATVVVPVHGKDRLLEVFQHFLPPRLAKVADRSAEIAVIRLAGPAAVVTAERAGIGVPQASRTAATVVGDVSCSVERPAEISPFKLEIRVARPALGQVIERLKQAGAIVSGEGALELARVLAGWPRLDAEIDGKTLPQEVRFDELNGVSYTKGCYTGQETVARVHFRGHVNRNLIGLAWEEQPDPADPQVSQDGRPVGRVTTLVWVDQLEQHIGLAVVRRGLSPEDPVTAAGSNANVVELPFQIDL